MKYILRLLVDDRIKSFKMSRVNVTDNAFHIKLANVGRAERHEESVKSEFLIRFSATTEKL